MAKKQITIPTGRVYEAIAEGTAAPDAKKKYKDRKTYTPEEAAEAMATGKTAGKKGLKMPRINLAFTPDNYEYIQTMARVRGENLTEFVNHIIKESMQNNADLYAKAQEFKQNL